MQPWRRGPFWRRHQGTGGPLRRDPDDRLLGGVAAGVAAWRGFNPTVVRIVFVLIALVTTGFGVAGYTAAWLLIPAAGADHSIASKARTDARGIALALGLGTLLTLFLLVGGVFNDNWFASWAWPQVGTVAGLVLIWRNGSADEQSAIRRYAEPLGAAVGETSRNRRSAIRLAVATVLILSGAVSLAKTHASLALLAPLGGVAAVVAGLVLFLGPWWLRIARDLGDRTPGQGPGRGTRRHRGAGPRLGPADARADPAAGDDPQKVVWLARMQERELRSWLFEGRAPNEPGEDTTVAAGVRRIQQDVEARYGVPVEAVTVGDCALDENLSALLAAAREATVNAAKWSGAGVISLFAEVEPEEVSVVVRDRGQGFDPESVPEDRKGLAESVHGRMTRRGGTATVTSAPGEGTKVSLKMPRRRLAAACGAQRERRRGSSWSTTTGCSGPGSAPSWAGRSTWWARRTTCSPRST